MPDDTRTVDVVIPVEPQAAAALHADEGKRVFVGHLVSQMLRPTSAEAIISVMNRISDEAERRGLTEEILQAELDAWKAERMTPRPG